jgi:chitinase
VAGTYTVTATVTDNSGASSSTSQSVTIKPQYVSVSSPGNGSSTTSTSVQVIGSAFSGYAVTAMQVYLDGVLKYQTSAGSVKIFLSLGVGTHQITVQGWDSSGATFKSSVTVTRKSS